MKHSTPRASVSGTLGSALRIKISSSGLIRAKYPIQLEQTEGVIKIRHTCATRFSLSVMCRNGGDTTPIDVDWGDGTITQEVQYAGNSFPQYLAAEAAGWHHTYDTSGTPRTITITPNTNVQIETLMVNWHTYVDYVGTPTSEANEQYDIIDLDLSDAAGLKSIQVAEQELLENVNLENSINMTHYSFNRCPNWNNVTLCPTAYKTYEINITGQGGINSSSLPLINIPNVSKLRGLNLTYNDVITSIDLSSESLDNLYQLSFSNCTNLSSVSFNQPRVLSYLSFHGTNMDATMINGILDQLIYMCQNPTPDPSEVASIESDILSLSQRISDLEDDITAKQVEITNKEAEITQLENDGYGEEDEVYMNAIQELDDLNDELSQLEDQLNSLNDELSQLEDNLQQVYDNVEAVTSGSISFSNTPASTTWDTSKGAILRDDFYWNVDDGEGFGGE